LAHTLERSFKTGSLPFPLYSTSPKMLHGDYVSSFLKKWFVEKNRVTFFLPVQHCFLIRAVRSFF
jgi:hypothetical protein